MKLIVYDVSNQEIQRSVRTGKLVVTARNEYSRIPEEDVTN